MPGQGVLGVVFLLGLAWLVSEKRLAVPWRLVATGVGLQFVMALLLLRVEPVEHAFAALNGVVVAVQSATAEGTRFVFGYLGGGDAPFEVTQPEHVFVLAFKGLPLILLVSALSALLFHWRVLPLVVRGFAWTLKKTLGLGGAVGFAAAANVFIGMIEAPLLIRPFLQNMSRSGLFMVMTAGMATIAGNMFVLYADFLKDVVPDAAGHLMTASLISAPAAIAIAALMVPGEEQDEPSTISVESGDTRSAVEALVNGTSQGVKLVISVTATLIVAVALVHLVNEALGLLPTDGGPPLTLQRLLGWAFAPVAWLLGVPWSEATIGGELLGDKVVLNELFAYDKLSKLPSDSLAPHSRLILTYALCGFANIGSLGILLGGLSTMVPDRREDIFALGPRSLLSGNLASFLTGTVVGLVG